MKKFIVSVCVAIMASFSCAAEGTIFDNPNNKLYFGVRVGGEITCPSSISIENVSVKMFNNGGGIEFGGIANIPVVKNFFIEPGVKLYYNTYSMKKDLFDYVDYYGSNRDISININKFGMRIPVMLGYGFDFTDNIRLSVFTGPELEIGFSAKEKAKYDGSSESESLYGDDGGLKRTDLIWDFGAGITYKKFYVGLSGGVGMLNMMSDDDDAKFHENRVTLSIGYNF